jgi:hypothetical protein
MLDNMRSDYSAQEAVYLASLSSNKQMKQFLIERLGPTMRKRKVVEYASFPIPPYNPYAVAYPKMRKMDTQNFLRKQSWC